MEPNNERDTGEASLLEELPQFRNVVHRIQIRGVLRPVGLRDVTAGIAFAEEHFRCPLGLCHSIHFCPGGLVFPFKLDRLLFQRPQEVVHVPRAVGVAGTRARVELGEQEG
jgi:hypothetical protein